jgi:hypothetical protein
MKKRLSPGEVAPVSGLYEIIGPRGGHTGVERTVPKGDVLPPTPEPGMSYEISERAHNKSGHNPKK